MSLPDEDDRFAWSRKKLPHGRSDTGAGALHQRFHVHAARERTFFRRPHRRGAHDGRVHSVLRTLLSTLLLLAAALALLAAAMRARGLRRPPAAPAKILRGDANKIAAERNASQAGGQRARRRRLPLNSSCDLLCQPLRVISGQRETAVGWIGQEP